MDWKHMRHAGYTGQIPSPLGAGLMSKSLELAIEDPALAMRLVVLRIGTALAMEAQGRAREEPPPKPAPPPIPRKRGRRKGRPRLRRR
jgi:hypothetical protein